MKATGLSRVSKDSIIGEIEKEIKGRSIFFVVQHGTLSAASLDKLRAKLRTANTRYFSVKNSLGRRAFDKADMKGISESLTGSCGIAFADKDPVAPSKILMDFAKENQMVKVQTAYMNGQIVGHFLANVLAHHDPAQFEVHGYSATRQEVFPLAERLAAQLGANLFHTRLTGHGRDGAAMLEGSVAAWQEDALEALGIGRVIGERVVLLSTSTGGTLSTWLASRTHDEALAALVMISPNFAARERTMYLLDWPLLGPALLGYLGDDYRSWQPCNERQARYWTWSYPYRALPELVRLMKEVERIDKSAIRVPTLMIYSPRDQVIDPAAVAAAFAEWGGERKRLVVFERAGDPSQHVLAGDILSPASTEEIARLISEYLNGLAGS